jgi:hypothetical protein
MELKKNYEVYRERARNGYDYYNMIERSVLEMEGEESKRDSDEEVLGGNGMKREELEKIVQ